MVLSLIERLERTTKPDNALDIEVEIALFVPDEMHRAVRPNDAGTKLVYERHNGGTDTYWAHDHTLTAERKAATIAALRALECETPA